jgi:hypothetical protein
MNLIVALWIHESTEIDDCQAGLAGDTVRRRAPGAIAAALEFSAKTVQIEQQRAERKSELRPGSRDTQGRKPVRPTNTTFEKASTRAIW